MLAHVTVREILRYSMCQTSYATMNLLVSVISELNKVKDIKVLDFLIPGAIEMIQYPQSLILIPVY